MTSPLDRIPLRLKLVGAVVALVTLALSVTGVAASEALRAYLGGRTDDQLVSAAPGMVGAARATLAGRPFRGLQGLPSQFYVRLYGLADGPQNAGTPNLVGEPGEVPESRLTRDLGVPFTISSKGHRWRAVALAQPDADAAVAFVPLDESIATVARLRRTVLLVSLIVLLVLGVVAYAVVVSSLRPLREVEATAAVIAGGDLGQRVPERDPRTEVGRLARAFNAMVSQIEHAFRDREQAAAAAHASEERMRRFVGDASHELRTPLTSIRGFAELYRQGAASRPEDVARIMRRVEDEAARMGLLVEDLLLLARLDQQRPLERRPVDLLALARDARDDAAALAPARTVDLRLTGSTPPVVDGDEARLRQVLGNLVTNALTHTPEGTPLVIGVGTEDQSAVLSVRDHGPGMGPAEAARVFERFYRADASRTRTAGGSGLGLSIVAALVAAHGGTVSLHTAPGEGATFVVRLPLAAPAVVSPSSAQ